jgi:hypothetical protein
MSLSKPANFIMVGLGRVELPTSPLSGVRSNQLSYRPVHFLNFSSPLSIYLLAGPKSFGLSKLNSSRLRDPIASLSKQYRLIVSYEYDLGINALASEKSLERR